MITSIVVHSLAGLLIALLVGSRARWKREHAAALERTTEAERKMKLGWEAQNTAADQAELQRRRADEFFSIIQGIEAERDTWKRFYDRSTQQAGVAQAWLLRDLENATQFANRYAAELRKAGKNVRDIGVSPQIGELMKELGLRQEEAEKIERAPGFEKAKEVESAAQTEIQAAGQDSRKP